MRNKYHTRRCLNINYNHFTTFERARIETLNNSGYSRRYIGNLMEMHYSTVARELSRNTKNYEAEKANAKNLKVNIPVK
nr:helix-turn-helix domain-containing protein [Clostridium sp. ZS1]